MTTMFYTVTYNGVMITSMHTFSLCSPMSYIRKKSTDDNPHDYIINTMLGIKQHNERLPTPSPPPKLPTGKKRRKKFIGR